MKHILEFEKQLNIKYDKQNLSIDNKKWKKKNQKILNNNIKCLEAIHLLPQYATTYSLIKNRIEILECLLENFHHNLNYRCKCKNSDKTTLINYCATQAPLFWISYSEIQSQLGVKREIIASSLLLFNLLGLVYKLQDKQVPDDILKRGESYKKINHYNNHMNYYYVPPYNKTLFNKVEKRAQKLKSLHFQLKSANRQWVLRTLGKKYADILYPQFIKKNKLGTSKRSNRQTKKLESIILKAIEKDGYIFQNKLSKNPQWGISKHEILTANHLICKYANKETKEKFNITKNGYIIYKSAD